MRQLHISLLVGALALLVVAPAGAQGSGDSSFRFRIGLYEPDAESEYWQDKLDVWTGNASDFEDTALGVDYVMGIGSRTSAVFSVDAWEGEATQAYRDYVDDQGNDIRHVTSLEATSLSLGLRLDLIRKRGPVVPYVGVGGGFYWWELTEAGDFIDFGVEPAEIFSTVYASDGAAFGYYWNAGVELYLSPDWAVVLEGRWHDVDDDLSDDLDDLGTLDLSGQQITAGLSFRF
jgi:opacity protein-like surface antigen